MSNKTRLIGRVLVYFDALYAFWGFISKQTGTPSEPPMVKIGSVSLFTTGNGGTTEMVFYQALI
jgi:hypothetical protein